MELENLDLFSSLTGPEIHEIERFSKRVLFGRNEIIFREGDFEKNLYIVETGQVEVFKRDPIHGEVMVAVFKNGDYFGELALFEKGASRSTTARAVQNTVLIVIEGQDFEKLLQMKPGISMKLLGTLSRRLRNTTAKLTRSNEKIADGCRMVSVVSAKDGYGKTTFAVSLAHLLANELGKKVLFIDLDLYLGGGSYFMGVHSPRSLLDLTQALKTMEGKDEFFQAVVKSSQRVWVVPCPQSFLDAEKIRPDDLLRVFIRAREYFDYIVVDTQSHFGDLLLNSIDMSDSVFCLVDVTSLASTKDSLRFLQGLGHLHFPPSRISIVPARVGQGFAIAKYTKVFPPYPVVGALPEMQGFAPDFGQSAFMLQPNGPYCDCLRVLAKKVLGEEQVKKTEEKGLLYRLFYGSVQDGPSLELPGMTDGLHNTGSSMSLISPQDIKSLVKTVRYKITLGKMQEAKESLLSSMEYSQVSGSVCELLGEIYLYEQRYADAIEAFKKAVLLEPDNALANGFLGCIANDDTALQKSIGLFKTRLSTKPGFADQRNDFGKVLLNHGDFAAAKEQFEEALKINPAYLEARINLASTLAALNSYTEGIELLLNIPQKNPRIYLLLGRFFYETSRFFLAYKAYIKVEEENPEFPGLRQKVLELSAYFKKLDSVIEMHERFVQDHSDFPDLHVKLGNFYNFAGRWDDAINEFKIALELKPGFQEAKDRMKELQLDFVLQLARTRLDTSVQDHQIVSKDFKLKLRFSEGCRRKFEMPEKIVVKTTNVRSGTQVEKTIKKEEIGAFVVPIELSQLGILAVRDLLKLELIDPKDEGRICTRAIVLDRGDLISNEMNLPMHSDPVPLERYFFVDLKSKHLATIINGKGTKFKAVVTNTRNGMEAQGFRNPESDESVNFLLVGKKPNGEGKRAKFGVVKAGDKLLIKVFEPDKPEVFSMEIAVDDKDVQSLKKQVVLQEAS